MSKIMMGFGTKENAFRAPWKVWIPPGSVKSKMILAALIVFGLGLLCSSPIIERVKELEWKMSRGRISDGEMFELAVMYHELALQGYSEYIDRGLKTFTRLDRRTGIYARDPECIVRYGSLLCLKGIQYWFAPIRLWYLLNGILDMERGMAKASGKTEISAKLRFIRAETYLKIGSDDMVSLAIKDLELLSFYYRNDREKLVRIYEDLIEAYKIKKKWDKVRLYTEKLMKITGDEQTIEEFENSIQSK